MTPAQYARLPELAREIVDTDRAIDALVGRPVVPLADVARLRDLQDWRGRARAAAHEIWGAPIGGRRGANAA